MILVGDCLEVMPTMQAASVDSIVCDPPYGLGFMGKGWDHSVPGSEFWREALRVAKPGAHLVAFGGTRTFHRLACAIEDAGWELRDTLMWVYGSGFPKSLDVSKAIDKAAGVQREVVGAGRWAGRESASDLGRINDDAWQGGAARQETAPATETAREWDGWGTALKPAWEPIILARKPLIGTVAANVQAHGTGGLNIEGCRVGGPVETWPASRSYSRQDTGAPTKGTQETGDAPAGRWPANVVHDGSEEVLAAFPKAPGQQGDLTGSEPSRPAKNAYGNMAAPREFKARREGEASANRRYTEEGGTDFAVLPGTRRDPTTAARFFYCAKADRADRNDGCEAIALAKVHGPSGDGRCWDIPGSKSTPRANNHPTVKPTDLMRWLCRLVTPPGGLVLDPFTGSGSTGRGAIAEGFRFVGIEVSPEYAAIAEARIRAMQPGLAFGGGRMKPVKITRAILAASAAKRGAPQGQRDRPDDPCDECGGTGLLPDSMGLGMDTPCMACDGAVA